MKSQDFNLIASFLQQSLVPLEVNVEHIDLSMKNLTITDDSNDPNAPKGFIWDAKRFSCAYDSILTILL